MFSDFIMRHILVLTLKHFQREIVFYEKICFCFFLLKDSEILLNSQQWFNDCILPQNHSIFCWSTVFGYICATLTLCRSLWVLICHLLRAQLLFFNWELLKITHENALLFFARNICRSSTPCIINQTTKGAVSEAWPSILEILVYSSRRGRAGCWKPQEIESAGFLVADFYL